MLRFATAPVSRYYALKLFPQHLSPTTPPLGQRPPQEARITWSRLSTASSIIIRGLPGIGAAIRNSEWWDCRWYRAFSQKFCHFYIYAALHLLLGRPPPLPARWQRHTHSFAAKMPSPEFIDVAAILLLIQKSIFICWSCIFHWIRLISFRHDMISAHYQHAYLRDCWYRARLTAACRALCHYHYYQSSARYFISDQLR